MKFPLVVLLLSILAISSVSAYDDEIIAKYQEIIRLRTKSVENAKKQEGRDPGIIESLEMELLKTKAELAEEQNDIASQISYIQESIKILTKTRDRFNAIAEGDETMANMSIGIDIGILQLETEILKLRRKNEQPIKSQ
ncbi:hypothetical protein VSU19_13950 [Verrucomicrobiales bacterium BCK34]|nr:hypothetical protein [Verrucomicrobiales bacterium BCK34]